MQTAQTRESNYVLWQKQSGQGGTVETMALPSFVGGVSFKAPGGLSVQIPEKGEFKTQIQSLAKQPGMDYLKTLTARNDVNWQPVKLAFDKWSYSQSGLTPAGAALVAVAVAWATGGMGAELLGVTGSTTSLMANAAFTSLASQASITLINNKGDVGKTLKDLGSSSTVKAALAAALTAGVLDKVAALPGMQELSQGTAFSDKLTYNLINATGRALTGAAINGGSLEEALKAAIVGAAVDTAHGAAASQIKGLEADYIAHKLAHALAGCVAGAAAGGACRDGAIGAAVGEMVAQLFEGQKPSITASDAEKKAYSDKVLAYSKLIAGGVSAYSGGNAQTAITTAEIATQNNYLSKPQLTALQAELNACKANNCTEAQTNAVLDKYANLSAKNDAALAACTTQACIQTHRNILLEAASVSSSVMWQVADARGSQQLIGELLGRQNQASNLQYLQARVERVEQARKQLDQYVVANCQGLSQSACSTKLQKSQAFTNTLIEVFAGFTPAGIAIDIKDLLQAKTMGDYSLAVLGVVLPGVGDGIKGLVKGGSKSIDALADMRAALTQQVGDLRAALTGTAKTSGNMGVAQIDIAGIQPMMAASSQVVQPTAAQRTLGLVGEVPETFLSSVVPTASGFPLNRVADSEAKILNNIAAKLGENRLATGTINLLTERAPCASCSNVIQQFKEKYPNIKVTIIDNGGVIPPAKKGF